MKMNKKQRLSVEEMLAVLEDPKFEETLSGQKITAESFNSFLPDTDSVGYHPNKTLRARFFGSATDLHTMDVKPAAKALSAVQDVLSAIGASLNEHTGQVGQLPANIVQATRLVFSPVVMSGSVVFTLRTPILKQETLPGLAEENSLIDDAVVRFIEILSIASSSKDVGELSEMLQRIDPRTASHIYRLSDSLVTERVGLALEWLNGNGGVRSVEIQLQEVKMLREFAKNSTTQIREVSVSGILSTASKDHRQEITLEDHTRVSFSATEAQLRELAPHILSTITVRMSQKSSVSQATNQIKCTYAMLEIEQSDNLDQSSA